MPQFEQAHEQLTQQGFILPDGPEGSLQEFGVTSRRYHNSDGISLTITESGLQRVEDQPITLDLISFVTSSLKQHGHVYDPRHVGLYGYRNEPEGDFGLKLHMRAGPSGYEETLHAGVYEAKTVGTFIKADPLKAHTNLQYGVMNWLHTGLKDSSTVSAPSHYALLRSANGSPALFMDAAQGSSLSTIRDGLIGGDLSGMPRLQEIRQNAHRAITGAVTRYVGKRALHFVNDIGQGDGHYANIFIADPENPTSGPYTIIDQPNVTHRGMYRKYVAAKKAYDSSVKSSWRSRLTR